MAQIMRIDRAAEDILRYARISLTNAGYTEAAVERDAESYLRRGVTLGQQLRREIEDHEEALETARARQASAADACDEQAILTREELFNRVGRKMRDPLLGQICPDGSAGVTDRTPRYKPAAVRALAVRIETVHHPRIDGSTASALAGDLREVADALDDANEALVPLLERSRAQAAQFAANARYLQIQLRRLKKHWAGEGRTDQEIHKIIPDGRRPVRGSDAPSDEGAAGSVPADNAPEADPEAEPETA